MTPLSSTSQMHNSQVWIATAAPSTNSASLATGELPLLCGCAQSPFAARAAGAASRTNAHARAARTVLRRRKDQKHAGTKMLLSRVIGAV
jgi:hypothetical protein